MAAGKQAGQTPIEPREGSNSTRLRMAAVQMGPCRQHGYLRYNKFEDPISYNLRQVTQTFQPHFLVSKNPSEHYCVIKLQNAPEVSVKKCIQSMLAVIVAVVGVADRGGPWKTRPSMYLIV